MGLINRIINFAKSLTNDTLDKLEDTEKMLKQSILDMEDTINKTKLAVAQSIANEKILSKKLENYKIESKEWEDKAKHALKEGREDLAQKAVLRKTTIDKNIRDLEPISKEAKITSEKLKRQMEALLISLDEAKARESTLVARSQFAKSQKKISSVMGGIGETGFGDFTKHEENVLKAEAEAEAYTEMADENGKLDREIDDLGSSARVQNEIDRLKAELLSETNSK